MINLLFGKKKWEERSKLNNNSLDMAISLMRSVNPVVIPRNYKVEEALNEATKKNDLKKVHSLLEILQDPYSNNSINANYQSPPAEEVEKYKTFCGT